MRQRGGFIGALAGPLSIAPMFILLLGATAASGQEFPLKPVRIITGGTGGGGDFTSRLLAQELGSLWGQQVVVDNRPSGVIPGETVARSAPDGYTILVALNLLWLGHLLQDEPYDPVRDFAPVTQAATSPNILLVHPSVPAKSIKELIALARARPGELSYGTGANGSASHLGGELLKSMAKIRMVRIPYKTNTQHQADVLGGHIQMTFTAPSGLGSFISSGRLRALAVTSAQRAAALPDLPAMAETLPGYEAAQHIGVFAPAKMPATLVSRLNRDVLRVLSRPDVKERMSNIGFEPVGSSPEQFASFIKADIAKWSKVIKEGGTRAN
jgi:tripartite-type tricarboxylate transporter receptor subunit TctC